MTRNHPTLLLAALVLAGCAGLPDQQLARQARDAGDHETAERNYRQLADLGFVEAQVGLADIQAESGDPQQMALAEQSYRRALNESPRAKMRLGRLLARKPQASEAERREAERLLEQALADGESGALLPLAQLYLEHPQYWPQLNLQERIEQWRGQGYAEADLAQIEFYRSQGTYAEHLAEIERICTSRLSVTKACYVELAQVYQIGGQSEQQKALLQQLRDERRLGQVDDERVESVALVLADAELGKPDEESAQALLEEIAPDYPAAWLSLAKVLYDYPALGDSERMFDYIERGRAASPARAELLLGRLYYEGKWVTQDPRTAERHLLKAAAGGESNAHYYLGQMYRRGYLGYVDPQKAVDHLLLAARDGSRGSDMALAQLFIQGRGIKVDPSNAYVFARLAQLREVSEAGELLTSLESTLSAQEKAQGERLLQQELQARGSAWQSNLEVPAVADGQPQEQSLDARL